MDSDNTNRGPKEIYHDEPWLDFNMFQSGHRRYGQLQAEGDYRLTDGLEEDNWRYVRDDRQRIPARPTLDAPGACQMAAVGRLLCMFADEDREPMSKLSSNSHYARTAFP